jgi:hypothetical protein
LKIGGYALSGAMLTFMIIGLMIPQAHAQTSPLTEDQDGDGDPLSEEEDISRSCNDDLHLKQASEDLGTELNMTLRLSKGDCDFVMHYLSGQCEKQNVESVCTSTLADYLITQGLFNTDYPTDTARFNALLEEREQKRIQSEQQLIRDEQEAEANRPDWTENVPMVETAPVE